MLTVRGEHPAQIPAGQRENPWLRCVEHREQQVRLFDLLYLFWCELGDAGDAQRSGDDRRSRRGDAVLSEGRVVRCRITGQMIKKVPSDRHGQLVTGELLAAEGEVISRMQVSKCTSS